MQIVHMNNKQFQEHAFPIESDEKKYSLTADDPSADNTTIYIANDPPNMCAGFLTLEGEVTRYPLKLGLNTIGRLTASHAADIQIPDRNHFCTMSRIHLQLNVVCHQGMMKHMVALAGNGIKNETLINDLLLRPGMKVVLHDGDCITVGKQVLICHLKV